MLGGPIPLAVTDPLDCERGQRGWPDRVKAYARRVSQLEKQAFVLAVNRIRNPRKHCGFWSRVSGASRGLATLHADSCHDGTLLEVVCPDEDSKNATEREFDFGKAVTVSRAGFFRRLKNLERSRPPKVSAVESPARFVRGKDESWAEVWARSMGTTCIDVKAELMRRSVGY